MKAKLLNSVLLLVALTSVADEAKGLGEGDALPDLRRFNLEGVLPATEGKVVLIDFWASWCAPCKVSFPYLDGIIREYAAKGFELIAVSQDDDREAMERFLESNPVSFSIVRDRDHKLAATVQPPGMPTTLLVDKNGRIRHLHKGFHGEKTADQLREWIKELLSE
ncbi:MAG: TlpA family protein disulfide reductase [Verrucomicrobia bacterium]|nr:TlpA family protein disulfide reductase [Verrucomicrobiota bacterium]